MIFGEKVREGLREEAACELCLRRAERAWQSGQVERDEHERSTCMCAGSIREEGDKAGKVYCSPFLKEQAKETGLSLKGQRFSKCTRASSTGSWSDMLIPQPLQAR